METAEKSNSNIKTYLKVRMPTSIDKQYYSISNQNRRLTLYDPVRKCESNKSIHFEIDEIFTEKQENKYIFEKICNSCIAETFKGVNYTFMSYGDTNSDKLLTHIGGNNCYIDQSQLGLYPRFLEKMLEEKKINPLYRNKIKISMSYFMICGVKMIDLSKYIGKDITNLTGSDVISSGFNIKNNADNLLNIRRISIDNVDQVFEFLQNLFKCFQSLNESYELMTMSHFCFAIYVLNDSGCIISTTTFLLLAGSENLPTKVTNPNLPSKSLIDNTKATLDKQAAFVSMINSISNQKTMEKLEKSEETKLSIVLYKLCFSPLLKMEYRIIGNILPNTGMYSIVHDTLVFLFKCKRVMRLRPDIEKVPEELKLEVKKEDIVYSLENKLNNNQRVIQELDERLNVIQKNIDFLESKYQKDTEAIKEKFNFVGDTNLLLCGNEYTREAKLARKIRESVEISRIKGKRIDELEEKVNLLQKEKAKLLELYNSKQKDQNLIDFYTLYKENNETAELDLRNSHMNSVELANLQKKNDQLQALLLQYKNDIELKANEIISLPQVLQTKREAQFSSTKLKEDIVKHTENKFKREIKSLREHNKKELDSQLENQTITINNKEKEIIDLQNSYEALKSKSSDINQLVRKELVILNDLAEYLLDLYKNLFDKRKYGTNVNSEANFELMISLKEQFEKAIELTEISINKYQFPVLFKYFQKKNNENKLKGNQREIISSNKSPINKKDYELAYNSGINDKALFQFIEPKTDEEMDLMTAEALDDYIKKLLNQINEVGDFSEKYIRHKKGFKVKEFDYSKEYINQLLDNISKLKGQLNEQVAISNNNVIKLRSQERSIDKVQTQNTIYKSKLSLVIPNYQSSNFFFHGSKRLVTDNVNGSLKNHYRQTIGQFNKNNEYDKRSSKLPNSFSTSREKNRPASTSYNFYKNNNI